MLEAVLIIFSFKDQIHLVKRQNYLMAFPGYHSFPGGKVDRHDHQAESADHHFWQQHPQTQKFSPALIAAVAREAHEEVHFDLKETLRNNPTLIKKIEQIGVAETPAFNPHRFKTYFFHLQLNEKFPFRYDENEVAWGKWLKAKEWLDLYHQGELLLVPPLVTLLTETEKQQQLAPIPQLNLVYDEETEVPCIESIFGVRQMPTLSNTLPPADRTNCFLIGDEVRYLIDPSPRDHSESMKLQNVVKKLGGCQGIFLTHHHPDHYENVNTLARLWKIPIKLSLDTYQRITEKMGQDYFFDIQIEFASEGEVLTHWLGEEVMIYHLPGHDEGQLGLAPKSKKWFLVGDLIQGQGTVVIAAPEGDMQKYFHSLERVINLQPQTIIPSHGIILGGVHFLQTTLKHRKMREEEVLQLFQQGKSTEEMLQVIYSHMSLSPLVKKLAMANIHSHLEKLKKENKIPN